jgi:DNA-binding CsgD family transcriptional regulator
VRFPKGAEVAVPIEAVTTLLEREHDLTELRNALTEAQQGRGRLIVVEAPAGLGKTSLLRAAFQTAAATGFTCLRARAGELERDFAYGCLRQLLEPVIAKASATERARLFEGAAGLSTPLFTRGDVTQPLADNAFSMLHGLYWLLNNLAGGGPVALWIDDLHWCDTESLQFLNYLAPRLDGVALTVLTSTRVGEGVTPDLARLCAGPDTIMLRPQPLSIHATAALCERVLGTNVDDAFAAACREVTGGNPFFLEALLREASERKLSAAARDAALVRRLAPSAVARAVLLRLSGAPTAATALVNAAAVLGDGASVAEAAHVAEISTVEAAHAADLLVARSILKPAEGIEFAHSIVREAVYGARGANDRADAHARAARILAELGASDERVAAQIAEAKPSGAVERVELLRRVAAAALARGAPAAAAAWLRRALAEPPPPATRPEVLLELGSAELLLAKPESVDHLAAAVETIRQPRLLAKAARHLANGFNMIGEFDRAVATLDAAIRAVEREDRELALLLTAELAAKAQQARRETRAPAAERLARHGALEGSTPGERMVLASIAFEQARASESAVEAAAHIERGLAGGRLLEEQEPDVVGPFYALLLGLLATDALDLADASLEQALARARARASVPAVAFLLAHRAWFALRRGAVAQTETDARSALDLLTTHGIRLGCQFALAALIWALIERGAIEAAEHALRSSGLGDEIPPALSTNDLLEARGALRLEQGKAQEGLADLLEFGRRDALWGGANPLGSRWRSRAALVFAAIGDVEQARSLVSDDLERARRWGAATDIGVALRAGALVDRDAAIVDRLREAADVLERSPARLEHARALADLGAAQRRANRRADARGTLEEALKLARLCNADALVARARVELRAAGGRSSDSAGVGLQSLTVSERRVAELAAKGQSNPKIAQALFVTRKTVETHLGHIYSKLAISGRAELGRALAGPTSTAEH